VLQPLAEAKSKETRLFFTKTRTLIKSVREWDHMESTNSPAKACWGECPPGAPTIGRGKIQRNTSFFFTKTKKRMLIKSVCQGVKLWHPPAKACWTLRRGHLNKKAEWMWHTGAVTILRERDQAEESDCASYSIYLPGAGVA